MKKLYIGIDPDLRLLNAALVTDQKKVLAVLLRRNKNTSAPVANAARMACRLIDDVIAWVVANPEGIEEHEIHLVIESQNMMHTKRMRDQGKKVDYDDMRRLSQVTGCLMGAFSNISTAIHLVQPRDWKGNVPKGIHHQRIYNDAGLGYIMAGGKEQYGVPTVLSPLTDWSHDKINPGDFKDISDSIGLALYGVKKGL